MIVPVDGITSSSLNWITDPYEANTILEMMQALEIAKDKLEKEKNELNKTTNEPAPIAANEEMMISQKQ